MSQYAKLRAQIEQLQAQAEEARRAEMTDVIALIRQKIVEYGLAAHDLGFAVEARRGRPPKKVLPPQYRDPATGKTWSGRGRSPKWIVGKNRERFLITR